MNILVPNLGSTSLKYQVLAMPSERVLARDRIERVRDYRAAVAQIRLGDTPVDAVAFKTVHGGPNYRGTYLVDEGVLAALEEFLPAAPVHNAIYLAAIRAFQQEMPGVPLVAAFETEFHATMPEYAARYGVPTRWRERYGIRRYGFHGASHEYVSWRIPELLGRPRESLRLVSCHLGGSSSVCAIAGGRSVDVTMGFSPQSGLENATRHGDLDVFAVLTMMERCGWSVAEVRQQLAREGGLAGLSGVPGGDVRDLEREEAEGNRDAGLALEVFAYQVKKTIGAYAAAMGGLDAVAFTGGIGENSARLRALCCAGLEFLGIQLDAERNRSGEGDRLISPDGAPVAVVALATNEELIVARRAYRVLAGQREGCFSPPPA
ncbi:MAG: acetate/propionate family kinase [Bryobacterales bacterium]|nr:acetate/propionate family kinase [Bryobacteraceae bacterium]MDW8355349.1 acetate/propionate family kinase [Bryobacterales bacterium]